MAQLLTYEDALSIAKSKLSKVDRDGIIDILARVGVRLTSSKVIFEHSVIASRDNHIANLHPSDKNAK